MNPKDFETGQDIIRALQSANAQVGQVLRNLAEHPERLRGVGNELETQLKTLTDYVSEQARVADANCKEWLAAGPGGKENAAYRSGMWHAYNDVRNRLPQNPVNPTDPTRYRFPELFSPSHADHIANLERALAEAVKERPQVQEYLDPEYEGRLLSKIETLEKAAVEQSAELEKQRKQFEHDSQAWVRCKTDSKATLINLQHGSLLLTPEDAIAYLNQQGWHSPAEWAELEASMAKAIHNP